VSAADIVVEKRKITVCILKKYPMDFIIPKT
jgi:hypothetical protein